MTTRRRLVVGLLLIGVVSGTGVVIQGQQPAPANKAVLEQQINALKLKRLEAADDTLEAMQAAFDAQTVSLGQVFEAMSQLAEAKLALASTPAERLKVLEQQVARLSIIERKVARLYQTGTIGGEAKEHARSQLERLNWELRLTQEQLDQLDAPDR